MRKLLILFLLLLLSVQIVDAVPSRWVQIGEKTYIDIVSIKPYSDVFGTYNNVYSFWIKDLNDNSKYFKNIEKVYQKKVWYELIYMAIDCNSKKFVSLSALSYDLQLNVIRSNNWSIYTGWFSIAPESRVEAWHSLVCLPEVRY